MVTPPTNPEDGTPSTPEGEAAAHPVRTRRHVSAGPRGTRRRARELALQALYQSDISGQPVTEAVAQLVVDQDEERVDLAFFRACVLGVDARRGELDALIAKVTDHWNPDRFSTVDRNVLRLGVYELLALPDVPLKVVINEAVELSKRFGGEGSGGFVNGVLDRLAGEVRAGGQPA